MKLVLTTLALFALVACATPYQENGFGGGVSASIIDGRHARISARGNAFTDAATIQDYALLKAAEETVSIGKRYFMVVSADDTSKVGQYTTPTQSYTSTTGTVNANTFGNTTYGTYRGNTNTTVTGGQTYNFVKPGTDVIIRMFAEEEVDPTKVSVFDAPAIIKFLGAKYLNNDK